MSLCTHDHVCDGPRVPLRYGSAPTEVCRCGCWRMLDRWLTPWQPAETLSLRFYNDEEARRATAEAGDK